MHITSGVLSILVASPCALLCLLCLRRSLLQSTRDHDAEPSTAQSMSQHAQRADAASDADSEDDLLNQVHPTQN